MPQEGRHGDRAGGGQGVGAAGELRGSELIPSKGRSRSNYTYSLGDGG